MFSNLTKNARYSPEPRAIKLILKYHIQLYSARYNLPIKYNKSFLCLLLKIENIR